MTTPTRLDIHVDLAVECARYNVFLDDRQLFNCEVADVTEGYVIQQRKHPLWGTLLHDRKGKIMTRRLTGVVRIERK